MILLSLASKQIWPQVLAVLHARPQRLVLFCTDEESESRRPAERLRDFFPSGTIPHHPQVELRSVPHDRFKDIVDAFASTAEQLELDDSNCRVHLTGGNKLMAMAAAEWCRLAGVSCFYLERDLRVFPFLPKGADLLPQPDYKLDPHLARNIEPMALLQCQLSDSEIVSPGQRVVLNDSGRSFPDAEFQAALNRRDDFTGYLCVTGPPPKSANAGDGLEAATAFALLKLGVPAIQRGIRLRSGSNRTHREEEGELDLVFNWAGKLWVVDCKHRKTPESRMAKLRAALGRQGSLDSEIELLLEQLTSELRDKELKPLKEDLLVISEAAGLLGRAVAVRWNPLPTEAAEFARSRRLAIILKDHLLRDLSILLYPDQPASIDQLRSLAAARTRASA
jgi:hypothetical protein